MSRKKRKNLPVQAPQPAPAQPNIQNLTTRVLQTIRTELFFGPLPRPEDLANYEKIQPGVAERIIRMTEQQGEHRRFIERQVVDSDISNSRRGAWFGFIIGMTGILIGGILIYLGKAITGSILGGTAIIGLVSVFVYGASQRKRERLKKYGQRIQ